MKLPAFEYAAPASLHEAVRMLAASDGTARVLAGGQSLLPVMAFRLAAPSLLVDLRAVPDLRTIAIGAQVVRLGSMVRWRDVARHDALAQALPILRAAVEHVAHYQIQNRGTIGGSLAHADPAAEFPGIAVTCDAIVEVVNAKGTRDVAAGDLFVGPLETSLGPDDIITGVRFPAWKPGRRWAFEEFARRRGDFALAAVAVFYDRADDGALHDAHIGVIGATDRPRRLGAAEAILNGRVLDEESIAAAAEAAALAVDPLSDLHGSAAYRRSLVATLLARALRKTID
jgi:carbon-monoxide dehydrogenase medium subunit